jgi:hypothetical protein
LDQGSGNQSAGFDGNETRIFGATHGDGVDDAIVIDRPDLSVIPSFFTLS